MKSAILTNNECLVDFFFEGEKLRNLFIFVNNKLLFKFLLCGHSEKYVFNSYNFGTCYSPVFLFSQLLLILSEFHFFVWSNNSYCTPVVLIFKTKDFNIKRLN